MIQEVELTLHLFRSASKLIIITIVLFISDRWVALVEVAGISSTHLVTTDGADGVVLMLGVLLSHLSEINEIAPLSCGHETNYHERKYKVYLISLHEHRPRDQNSGTPDTLHPRFDWLRGCS